MPRRGSQLENSIITIAIGATFLVVIAVFVKIVISGTPSTPTPYPVSATTPPVQSTITLDPPTDTNISPSPNHTPTSTLTSTPTPPVADIDVLAWNVEYICKGGVAIDAKIVGAVITGGIPPYSVDPEYRNSTPVPLKYTSSSLLVQSSNKVIVDPPIIVNTGKNLTYILKSSSSDGKPDFSGTWYFPRNIPECAKNSSK